MDNQTVSKSVETVQVSAKEYAMYFVFFVTFIKTVYNGIKGFISRKKKKDSGEDHSSIIDISKERYNSNIDNIKEILNVLRTQSGADKAYLSVIYADNEDTDDVTEMKLSIIAMDCKDGIVNDMDNWQGIRLSKFNGLVKELIEENFGILYRRPEEWISVRSEYYEFLNNTLENLGRNAIENEELITKLLYLRKKNQLPYQLHINPYMQQSLDDQGCEIMYNLLITRLCIPSFIVGLDFNKKLTLEDIEKCKSLIKITGYKVENEKWIKTKGSRLS